MRKAPLKGELSAKLTEGFCIFRYSMYRRTPPPAPPAVFERVNKEGIIHQYFALIGQHYHDTFFPRSAFRIPQKQDPRA